ncbi:MAG: transcriptional regulator [Spirochaetes bacterium]|nr:transcriptional regulator [Spirochaetota bacterium]
MSSLIDSMTDHDFQKAQTKAFFSRLAHIFNPGEEDLLPFEEAKRILGPDTEHYSGLATIPLARIVGSEGRYRDFNRHFLPRKNHLKIRWMSIDEARYNDVNLPPVRLYEMGSVYFVRDGNHRVSVAKSSGQLDIDAEVVSLQSKVAISPDMSIEELKAAVIGFEKAEFYASTNYLTVVGLDDLSFSEPGRYDTITDHVDVHKYYLNEHEEAEISWANALFSWHENVYAPILLAIGEERLLQLFPGRTAADLYLYLVNHWDELKQSLNKDVGIGEAARDFKSNQGAETKPTGLRRFLRKILEKLKKELDNW